MSDSLSNLKSLAEQVNAAVETYTGNEHREVSPESLAARRDLLDSIEKLRVAALGPAEYHARLRYQVSPPG